MHDSLAAIPLSLISAERVTHLYDLMDAAYCSTDRCEHSKRLGHVPLIRRPAPPATQAPVSANANGVVSAASAVDSTRLLATGASRVLNWRDIR